MSEAMLEFLASMSGLLADHLLAKMLEHMSENTRLLPNFAVAFAATGLRSCAIRRARPFEARRLRRPREKSTAQAQKGAGGKEGDEQEEKEEEEEEGEWKAGDAGITSGDPLLRGAEKDQHSWPPK